MLTKKIAICLGTWISKYTIQHKYKFKNFSDKDIENITILGCHMIVKNLLWLISLFVITKFFFYKLLNNTAINSSQINLHLVLVYIYVFTYWIFRRKFGGAHFNSDFLCSIFSIILPILFSYLSLNINFNFIYIILAYIFSYFTAIYKGVVDSPKKPLTSSQKAKLKREGILLLKVISFFHISIYILNYLILKSYVIYTISNIVVFSVLSSYGSLYFGKNSSIRRGDTNES